MIPGEAESLSAVGDETIERGSTGTERWRYATGAPVHGAVAVGPDRVIVATTAGTVLAIGRDDATLRARWVAATRVDAGPALAGDGTVVIGTYGGQIVQLAPDLGRVLGQYPVGGPVLSSPRVVDDAIYLGSDDNGVYRLRPAVG